MGVRSRIDVCPRGARSARPLDSSYHGIRTKPGKMRETRCEETGDSSSGFWFPYRHALPRRLADVAPSRPPPSVAGIRGGAAMCELRQITTAVLYELLTEYNGLG